MHTDSDSRSLTRLIDRKALSEFLEAHGLAANVISIQAVSGGASNITLRIEIESGTYVLRRSPLGKIPPRSHDMFREFTVMSALQGSQVPVPQLVGFHESSDIAGAPCYLMEFVEGAVLNRAADVKDLNVETTRRFSENLIEVLAHLHDFDISEVPLPAPREGHFVHRRIDGWLRQWNATPHRNIPEIETIGQQLRGTAPAQQRTTLVHGDYRASNVIFDDKSAEILAVLDWELSTFGDPLTDLAHLVCYWESVSGVISHPAQQIADSPGFMSGSELAAKYSKLTGLNLDSFSFYLAYEHWRAAIIREGIYQRGLEISPDSEETVFSREAVMHHLQEVQVILDSSPSRN